MGGLNDFDIDEPEEETLNGYVTNVTYTEKNGRPLLHLYVRDEDGTLYHVRSEGHRPSFFIPESEFSPQVTNHYAVHDVSETDEDGEPYEDPQGTKLVRIYTYLPKQVRDLREQFDTTYEADVFYNTRWLIDQDIWTGIRISGEVFSDREPYPSGGENTLPVIEVDPSDIEPAEPPEVDPRVIIADIEVASETGMPDAAEAQWPVSTIVAYDSYEDEYTSWILESDEHDQDTLIGLAEKGVRVFSDESDMLDDFNEYIADRRPDMLSGWHSNGFDYRYLINRCRNLDTWSFKTWSPTGEVYIANWNNEPVVKGVTMFDMLAGYDKTMRGEYSGKLDDVAKEELGSEKLDVEEGHTEMWKNDPVTFLEYNKRDVKLVKDIEEAKGIIKLYKQIRELTGAQFDDCHANIDLLDVYFLRKAREYGIVLPTATKNEQSWFYGAKVLDPKPGMHENVFYFDAASLYPNAIKQLNIGPETIVGFDSSEDKNTVHSYVDDRTVNVKKESPPQGKEFHYTDPSEEESFIRKATDDVIQLKDPYRGTDMYIAVKMTVNCFTPDTGVMTPGGVVNIRDLEVGDDVYSIDPETMNVEVKPVERTWEYPDYDGELVNIQNSVTDLSVTPNHRLLTHKWRKDDEFEWREAGELNEWSEYRFPHDWNIAAGDELDSVNIANFVDEYEIKIDPDVHGRALQAQVDWELDYGERGYYILDRDTYEKHRETLHNLVDKENFYIRGERYEAWTPLIWDGDDFIQFVGWYITEGSQYTVSEKFYDNGHHRGESTKISISQYDTGDGHVSAIDEVLTSIGLTYSYNDRSYDITGSKVVASALSTLCGIGSHNKKIPEMMFDVSQRQKQLLFDVLMAGDGDANTNRYTTASEQLRDDFMELSVHLGLQPKYHWEGGEYRHGNGVWRVRPLESKNSFTMAKNGITSSAENGVYSVTVKDNHTVLAGRNGRFQWVGQSIWGVLGDGDSYGGKGFRLFDWRMGESITLFGRRVISFAKDKTIEKLQERGYDAYATHGDTDGYGISIQGDHGKEELLRVAEEVSSEVNKEYGEFLKKEFDSDENYMEIEVESLADKLFIPHGSTTKIPKKRYVQHIIWDDDGGWDADETKITGLEYVRSDTAEATRKAQKRFVDEILYNPLGEAKESYYEWLRAYVNGLRSGDEPISDLARPKGMSMSPWEYGSPSDKPMPTYKGAKYANQFIYGGEKLQAGDKPYLYYVKHVGGDYPVRYPAEWDTKESRTKVDAVSLDEPDDLPEEIEVDVEKMIDKVLETPMSRMFGPLGWSFDDALSDTDQQDITDFM